MRRANLTPALQESVERLRAASSESGSGGVGVAGGDVVWYKESAEDSTQYDAGQSTSDESHVTKTEAGRVQDVAARVAQVESAVENLSHGVSTQGRWNTVSTSEPPSVADGFPEGAWWTQVASADDMSPQALWTVEDGQWVTRPLPAGTTVAPYLNTGLISAGAVAAAIIQSDGFWTALSGRRAGFNSDGFQSYDSDGAQTVRLDGQDNYIFGRGELGGWAMKTENGTSVIARADYGDITVSESGVPQQGVPHLETSPSRGTVLTHKSTASTPYLALKDDTAAVIANGDEADKYAQVSSAADESTVVAAQLAMRSSTEYASVQSNIQQDTTTTMGAVTKINAGSSQRAFFASQIGAGGPSASLMAGDQAVASGYTGFLAYPSSIRMLGPLSLGGVGSTLRLIQINIQRSFAAGSGVFKSFSLGIPERSDCRYWPIAVTPVESGGTADYVCKIQQFNPDAGTGQLWVQKVSGATASNARFVILLAMLKSSGWTWESN